MSDRSEARAETRAAQAELARALADLRGTLEPAARLVERGSDLAAQGIETGSRLLGAVSSSGAGVSAAVGSLSTTLRETVAPALSPENPTAAKVARGGMASMLALWGVKKLLGGESRDSAAPADLPDLLAAILPQKSEALTDADGVWLAEADKLHRAANQQIAKLERAIEKGQGDPDEQLSLRDEVLDTLQNALKETLSQGLDDLAPTTRARIIARRGEAYAAHLAQMEAERGGGGMFGMIRRHPVLAGTAVLATGAAAAMLLPKSAGLAVAARRAAPLAKGVAMAVAGRRGLAISAGIKALEWIATRRDENDSQSPPPLAVAEPTIARPPLVMDQYGRPLG